MNEVKLTYTVQELAKILNIGINSAYQLVNSKGFPIINVGKRKKLIPIAALNRWLESQESHANAGM